MKITLIDRNTPDKKELTAAFSPEQSISTPHLHLMMYCPRNYSYVGENAEIKTDAFQQIYVVRLQHLIYGRIEIGEKTFDAQLGCYLSEFNYKMEQALIYIEGLGSVDLHRYGNFHSNLLSDFDVKIFDYGAYEELITKFGNVPFTFKQYVLRQWFNNQYFENELDFYHANETSFFNVLGTQNEDDFITIKGMKVYFDEVVGRLSK